MRDAIRQQIFNYYADMIRSGQLIEGDALPTMTSDGVRWGASKATVYTARRRLREAGLIERGYGPDEPQRVALGWM